MRIVPIVLIGMMFGALAPQGFMPRYGESGLSIILCSGSGATAASIDQADPLYTKLARIKAAMSGRDDAPHPGDDKAQPSIPHCAFADGTMAATLSSPTMIVAPSAFASLAPGSLVAIALSRHHAARPPATGPPFLV